jgi:prophage regulatory protein
MAGRIKSMNTPPKLIPAQNSVGGMSSIGFMRLPQVLKIFPVSRSTWWAGVKSGRYPAGVKLSARVTAWRVETILSLIERGT